MYTLSKRVRDQLVKLVVEHGGVRLTVNNSIGDFSRSRLLLADTMRWGTFSEATTASQISCFCMPLPTQELLVIKKRINFILDRMVQHDRVHGLKLSLVVEPLGANKTVNLARKAKKKVKSNAATLRRKGRTNAVSRRDKPSVAPKRKAARKSRKGKRS